MKYSRIFTKYLLPALELVKGKKLLSYYLEYQSNLEKPLSELEKEQWLKLHRLIKHAYKSTKFYPEFWQKHGIESYRDIKSMEDFKKLPILTKSDILNHYDKLRAENYKENIQKSTGGSTGKPLHFELDMESNTRREAVMWRGYGWLGAGLGVKTLFLWGADLGRPSRFKSIKTWLYNHFYNRKVLNSFALNKENIGSYVDQINQYKPMAIVAYVNPLYEVARFILDNQIQVHSVTRILTGAEPLHDFQRDVIERAFDCNVYNTYGCREFMLISAECEKRKALHVNVDHLVVETINEQGDLIIDNSGELIITDLHNYGMPLIRYKNGDRATLSSNACDCGNPLPVMGSIDGRALDIIKTVSGGTIAGELFPHLFKEFKGIDKFQIQQHRIDELLINIVANKQFSQDDVEVIRKEIDRYANGELSFEFKMVDEIPLTSSGKHRVVICHI